MVVVVERVAALLEDGGAAQLGIAADHDAHRLAGRVHVDDAIGPVHATEPSAPGAPRETALERARAGVLGWLHDRGEAWR